MEKYRLFSVQEFMNDPYFQDWVYQPDAEKNNAWKKLIQEEPELSAKIKEAKSFLEMIDFKEEFPSQERVELALKHLQQKIKEPVEEVKVVRMSLWLKRIAVAASLLLAVSFGTYLLLRNKTEPTGGLVENVSKPDVKAPTNSKATIRLSNGTVVSLDSLKDGLLAQQSNVKVVKLADGRIAYQNENGEVNEKLEYNTLYNPRGSKVVDMILSDGSHVWLNAGSSVTYPVAFVGKERTVTIEGEAYFEIAKNAAKPFKVNVDGKTEVEVLGTHFNVNSYDDEATINTTLFEGKVKVTGLKTKRSHVLAPGQQAVQNKQGEISINSNADMDEVIAWKEGKFRFGSEMDIQTVMRQVARWYDITVEYRGDVKGSIGGSISRDVSAAKVLEMLEMTGTVQFKIEGKKVIVQNK
jgi:transmembrane sensor